MAIIWEPKYYTVGHHLVNYFYMKDKSLQYPLNIARKNCYFAHPLNSLYDISQIQKMIGAFPRNFCELMNQYDILHNWKVNNLINFSWRCLRIFIEDINIEYEYRNFINLIKDTSNILRNQEIREKEIKYTIGMTVTHSPKPYLPSTEKCNPHTGVIIGWNYKCKAAFVQKKLKSVAPHLSECCETRHMCFCKCYTCKSDNSSFIYQPHYIILAENNIVCYAPQDTVSRCPPKWINNVEIGRYFSHFEGTHYVPTKNLAKNYPTDIAIMHQVLSDQ
ncbi:F-box only protein 21-like [Camponotus floridanus]|uniref:F-box only protein 21-like n=1 Tax=Camponotus floridanus TaxID=104421 RepID=UPI000DC680FB|nr:F-box only protein 21-like [Camponotus floridanus]